MSLLRDLWWDSGGVVDGGGEGGGQHGDHREVSPPPSCNPQMLKRSYAQAVCSSSLGDPLAVKLASKKS